MRVIAMRAGLAVGCLLVLIAAAAGFVSATHVLNRAEVDRQWKAHEPTKLSDIGSSESLTIVPLVNWHTARDDLRGEMGVSYLVRTDSQTILFDLGHNADESDPSPLLHNMSALGVSPGDIDTIVISHNHFDHVGGSRWQDSQSFSLGNRQIDLSGTRVYTPVPMTYPGLSPTHTPSATRIGPGVATTGTIARQLFIGRIEEQALAVNVRDKGLVLIVGCGHQTLPKLLARTDAVFDEPLYGLIGDLHYPVPDGRLHILGVNVQRWLASGRAPWSPLSMDRVEQNLELLEDRSPGVIGLGGHDSSDEVIEKFRSRFGTAYQDVRVGAPITVAP